MLTAFMFSRMFKTAEQIFKIYIAIKSRVQRTWPSSLNRMNRKGGCLLSKAWKKIRHDPVKFCRWIQRWVFCVVIFSRCGVAGWSRQPSYVSANFLAKCKCIFDKNGNSTVYLNHVSFAMFKWYFTNTFREQPVFLMWAIWSGIVLW